MSDSLPFRFLFYAPWRWIFSGIAIGVLGMIL